LLVVTKVLVAEPPADGSGTGDHTARSPFFAPKNIFETTGKVRVGDFTSAFVVPYFRLKPLALNTYTF